jgi:hypothetical protein
MMNRTQTVAHTVVGCYIKGIGMCRQCSEDLTESNNQPGRSKRNQTSVISGGSSQKSVISRCNSQNSVINSYNSQNSVISNGNSASNQNSANSTYNSRINCNNQSSLNFVNSCLSSSSEKSGSELLIETKQEPKECQDQDGLDEGRLKHDSAEKESIKQDYAECAEYDRIQSAEQDGMGTDHDSAEQDSADQDRLQIDESDSIEIKVGKRKAHQEKSSFLVLS